MGILILSNFYNWTPLLKNYALISIILIPFTALKNYALISIILIPFTAGLKYFHFLRNLEKMENQYLLKYMLIKKGFIMKKYKNSFMRQLINQSKKNSKEVSYQFENSNQKFTSTLIYSIIILISIYFVVYFSIYKNYFKMTVALVAFIVAVKSLIRFLKQTKNFIFFANDTTINLNGQILVVDSTISKIDVTQQLELTGFHPNLNLRIGKRKLTMNPSLITGDKMLFILLYLQFYTGRTKQSSF
jgi:hypothetical protein